MVVLKGPSPTAVEAAIMHMYVVNGARLVAVTLVVVEFICRVRPVRREVTLIM